YAFAARELAPGVLTLPHRNAGGARRGDLGIRIAVGARADDDVRPRDIARVETGGDARAVPREGVGERPASVVRSAHLVAPREEEPRECGHPRAADPDDVVPHS